MVAWRAVRGGEKVLQAELEGYEAYMARVKHRHRAPGGSAPSTSPEQSPVAGENAGT
jgi:hypothetical protein